MSTLHLAARAGDIEAMKRLLVTGADLEEADNDGRTPLMNTCLSPAANLDAVRLLLDHGADVNALTRPPSYPALETMFDPELDACDDPEIREMLDRVRRMRESSQKMLAESGPERSSVLAVAVKEASPDKLQLLIERGADVTFQSAHGYTVTTLAACAGRSWEVFELLLAAGAPVDGESSYGESALRVLSREARFREVRMLLNLGANPTPLGWSSLHRAVALGSIDEVAALLDQGTDPEATDSWDRTALLLSVHAGALETANFLLERGANRNARGRSGRAATHYPIDRDDGVALGWLLKRGFPVDPEDDFHATPLMMAAEQSAAACFDLLIEAGADWRKNDTHGDPLIRQSRDPRIIRRLLELGQDAADLEADVLRDWIGLGTRDELPVSEAEYLDGRFRRFGNANPERMEVPFWNAMLRCGWDAYRAGDQFGDNSFGRDQPIWCHRRFGMSLTPLADGRFVQIGGEHEDHYDPDFCIYNDVIIHDGKGGFEILGYPEEVFPPTDFHSATLAGEWIYIIGNLSYPDTREEFGCNTPVFRFHVPTGRIERVPTRGSSPGWIHRHNAQLENGCIRVSGGKVLRVSNGDSNMEEFTGTFDLNLATGTWAEC